MHKVKKSMGQNFLKSEAALRAMCEAGEVSENDTVLEIGPGKGALTVKLLEKAKKVVAIEKDRDLIAILEEKFAAEIKSKKLILIQGDCLEYEPKTYKLEPGTYKIVANIPYNITGAIFKKFLSGDSQPEKMVVLVQKEVADRVVARNGKESILSLSVKVYGTPKYIMKVSKRFFSPAPKVDSAILAISGISKKNFEFPLSLPRGGSGRGSELTKNLPSIPSLLRRGENTAEDLFFEIVKAGFAHKRKVVRKNLEAVLKKDVIENIFAKLTIPPNARAEDVPLEMWIEIVKLVS